MIGIIDYGMGNLHSVLKGFEKVGAQARVITEPAAVLSAEKLVLPGVGAFRDAIAVLNERGLVEPIRQAAAEGRCFLGICLGMQLLFDVSYEDGCYEGLGIIPGKVVKFDFFGRSEQGRLTVPHMGWNALNFRGDSPLFKGLPVGTHVYFVHSYYVVPDDPSVIAATTEHGVEFVSSIRRGNLMATQFHPEKSQRLGLEMLRNFSAL